MSLLGAILVAASLGPPRILAIETEILDSRPALRVVTSGTPSSVGLRRRRDELVMRLDALGVAGLAPPRPAGPIREVRLSEDGSGAWVRVTIPEEVAYEVRREGPVLSVLFEALGAEHWGSTGESLRAEHRRDTAIAPSPRSDARDLYAQLFPAGAGEAAQETTEPAAATEDTRAEGEDGGVGIGSLRLRPGLTVSYVDGTSTLLEQPEPVRDSFFQIQPRIEASLVPLQNRHVQLSYEPRFRRASSFALMETTSHLFGATADLPLGAYSLLRGSFRHVRGVLETDEVDPGREYFYDLAQFRHTYYVLGVRVKRGGRLDLDLSGRFNQVRVEGDGFFDYEQRGVTTALGYELTPNLRAALEYGYDQIPAPDERIEPTAQAHSFHLRLDGEILPLLRGDLAFGYRDQENPNAGEGGRRYRGLSATGSLRREIGPASWITLRLTRATFPSGFGTNGFFVTSSGQVELTLPLPFYFSLRGGVGYHRNEYRVVISELGVPRRDRIVAWSAGLGRSFTRWSYLRADYLREERTSNVEAFNVDSDALVLQLGLGSFAGSDRR